MKREDVASLMRSSQSESDWNKHCDEVKAAFNGYPDFWYGDIIMSGLLNDTRIKNGW